MPMLMPVTRRPYNLRDFKPLISPLAFIDNNKVGVTLVLFENVKPPLAEFIMKQTQPADDVAEVHWIRMTDIKISQNNFYPEMMTPHGKIANANAHCIRLLVNILHKKWQPPRFCRAELQNYLNLKYNKEKVSVPLDQIPERQNLNRLVRARG